MRLLPKQTLGLLPAICSSSSRISMLWPLNCPVLLCAQHCLIICFFSICFLDDCASLSFVFLLSYQSQRMFSLSLHAHTTHLCINSVPAISLTPGTVPPNTHIILHLSPRVFYPLTPQICFHERFDSYTNPLYSS